MRDESLPRRLVGIQAAAEFLGVVPQTLRRWEREGRLVPDDRTPGGLRRYDLLRLRTQQRHPQAPACRTVAYARAAGDAEQLARQTRELQAYCSRQGWPCELVADAGQEPGARYSGIKRILVEIMSGQIGRLVIPHLDRLPPFGAELLLAACHARGVPVVRLHEAESRPPDLRRELAQDLLELVASVSPQLCQGDATLGRRLLEEIRHALDRAVAERSDPSAPA